MDRLWLTTYILIFTIATGLTAPFASSAMAAADASSCQTAQCLAEQLFAKKRPAKPVAKSETKAVLTTQSKESSPTAPSDCQTAQCLAAELLAKRRTTKATTGASANHAPPATQRASSAHADTATKPADASTSDATANVSVRKNSSAPAAPAKHAASSRNKRAHEATKDAGDTEGLISNLTVSDDEATTTIVMAPKVRTEAGISCPDGTCTAAKGTGNVDDNDDEGPTAVGLHPGQNLRDISDLAKVLGETNARMTELKQAPMCQQFATSTEINSWGQAIRSELHKRSMSPLYSGTRDIHRLCPRYDEMSDDERDGFWIVLVSGWAQAESSCNPSSYLPQQHGKTYGAPNGTAAGLLALHKSHEARYTPLSKACNDGDSSSPLRSLRCGLGMLNDLAKQDKNVFDDESHFATLRPHAAPRCSTVYSRSKGRKTRVCKSASEAELIRQSLRKYRFCHDAGMQTANR